MSRVCPRRSTLDSSHQLAERYLVYPGSAETVLVFRLFVDQFTLEDVFAFLVLLIWLICEVLPK